MFVWIWVVNCLFSLCDCLVIFDWSHPFCFLNDCALFSLFFFPLLVCFSSSFSAKGLWNIFPWLFGPPPSSSWPLFELKSWPCVLFASLCLSYQLRGFVQDILLCDGHQRHHKAFFVIKTIQKCNRRDALSISPNWAVCVVSRSNVNSRRFQVQFFDLVRTFGSLISTKHSKSVKLARLFEKCVFSNFVQSELWCLQTFHANAKELSRTTKISISDDNESHRLIDLVHPNLASCCSACRQNSRFCVLVLICHLKQITHTIRRNSRQSCGKKPMECHDSDRLEGQEWLQVLSLVLWVSRKKKKTRKYSHKVWQVSKMSWKVKPTIFPCPPRPTSFQ